MSIKICNLHPAVLYSYAILGEIYDERSTKLPRCFLSQLTQRIQTELKNMWFSPVRCKSIGADRVRYL